MPVAIMTGDQGKRPVWQSIKRGLQGRCPNCGKGRLLRGYLTPVAACPVCGEDLSHERSDDFAPYLTMIVVGHLVVPTVLVTQMSVVLSSLTVLAVALPAAAGLAFALLPPIKGAIIALQWALRMHGFDGSANPDAPEAVLAFPPARRPLTRLGPAADGTPAA